MGVPACDTCDMSCPLDDPRWQCSCGSLLDIELKPVFDTNRIQGPGPTMWRYREAIPIARDMNIISFDEGFTPMQSDEVIISVFTGHGLISAEKIRKVVARC